MTARQGLPGQLEDYTLFPSHTVAAGEAMWRAHNVRRGAWYFDSSNYGRFNLHSGRGTCYVAAAVETAVREKLRDEIVAVKVVSRALAGSFQVSEVAAPLPQQCAAVSGSRAVLHGIVRELVTMADYSVPQAWAQTFSEAGFDGVFYGSAYTTGDASAYGLFGPEGTPEPSAGYADKLHLMGPAACEATGIFVEDPPASREVEISRSLRRASARTQT